MNNARYTYQLYRNVFCMSYMCHMRYICIISVLHRTFKHCLHFSIPTCHPCAGAMLIFSVNG